MLWGIPRKRSPEMRKLMTCPSSPLKREITQLAWNMSQSPREREGLSLLLGHLWGGNIQVSQEGTYF